LSIAAVTCDDLAGHGAYRKPARLRQFTLARSLGDALLRLLIGLDREDDCWRTC
jgi:hypothetical protein